LRVFADLPWRVLVTNNVSRTLTLLDRRATGKQFLYTLNGPAYHTSQVASDEPAIYRPFPNADSPAVVSTNVRLVYGLQRWPTFMPPYQATFGGMLFNAEDEGADAATTTYQAYDPWQYMMSRPVRDPDSSELPGVDGLKFPPGSRANDIALALLETTQIVEGETHIDFSDGGLIDNTDPLPYGIKFDEGTMVGEAWQQLCATGTIDITLPPLYDPVNFPGKVVQFATSPRAGQVRYNAVMAWDKGSHSLSGLSRMVDGTRLADRVLFFAGQGGVPVPLQSDAASIAAHGEYWAQQFFPGTHDRNLVELLALAELQIRKNGARSLSFDPAPERSKMVLRDYGIGDYLPVWASKNLREPLGVDYDNYDADFPGASGYQRAYAIPVAVDDNGVARVRGILTSSETTVGG
jgi:hypothetical protein